MAFSSTTRLVSQCISSACPESINFGTLVAAALVSCILRTGSVPTLVADKRAIHMSNHRAEILAPNAIGAPWYLCHCSAPLTTPSHIEKGSPASLKNTGHREGAAEHGPSRSSTEPHTSTTVQSDAHPFTQSAGGAYSSGATRRENNVQSFESR